MDLSVYVQDVLRMGKQTEQVLKVGLAQGVSTDPTSLPVSISTGTDGRSRQHLGRGAVRTAPPPASLQGDRTD